MPPALASIFNRDYSTAKGNFDFLCGVDDHVTSETYRSQARVAGVGPHGLDVFRVSFIPTAVSDEPYVGHHQIFGDGNGPDVGTSWFARWYQFENAGNTDEPVDAGANFLVKRLIIGNGGVGRRMIMNIETELSEGLPHIEVIFDGISSIPTGMSGTFSRGAEHAIQTEWRYNGTNSYIKVWLDTDDYNNPTISYFPTEDVTQTRPDIVDFGAYSNDTLLTGHQKIFHSSAFRIGEEFDPNWRGWLQNGDVVSGARTIIGYRQLQLG